MWHSSTYRLETTLNYGLERVWAFATMRGSNDVAIGYDEGSVVIKVSAPHYIEHPVETLPSPSPHPTPHTCFTSPSCPTPHICSTPHTALLHPSSTQMGREEPAMSMDNSGKIMWSKHSEIQQANLKALTDTEVKDGERLPLAIKDMGSCEIFPNSIQHSPNGR